MMIKKLITISLISMASILFIGCYGQILPPEKFEFDSKFDSLYKAISHTDSMFFENSTSSIDTFVLTNIDSTFFNQINCYMCRRAEKSIFRYYKQYPVNYWTESAYENQSTKEEKTIRRDVPIITITKYPEENINEAYVSFKNFHSTIRGNLGTLFTDTVKVNNCTFSNYYIFNSTAKSLITSDHHVEAIYVTLKEGIIAYREKSGTLRKRLLISRCEN